MSRKIRMSQRLSYQNSYNGFEQGPIRPPSEAQSLLVRVTRNCPWNHCSFCPIYKRAKFSIRPTEHVIKDIDQVYEFIQILKGYSDLNGQILYEDANKIAKDLDKEQQPAFYASFQWVINGMRSIFIQDANSMVIKPQNMLAILNHLTNRFSKVARITSYARSHTIARISDQNLAAMRAAGLNRIHIGLESGSDKVLANVKKGVDQKTHVKAGRKIKQAGMELSEYVMPGLGGRALSHEHAVQSALALNQINPDFIRIRTLAIPNSTPLYHQVASKGFEKLSDIEMVKELRTFIQSLEGITSRIKSDHILNLFQEIEGRLPQDKASLLAVIDSFLKMSPWRQCLFQVGRRLGVLNRLKDLDSPRRVAKVETFCYDHGIRPDNVEAMMTEIMKRFV
jgi:radical SAM superfamily enzyme YgiQ (UPF0313 family)